MKQIVLMALFVDEELTLGFVTALGEKLAKKFDPVQVDEIVFKAKRNLKKYI